MHEQDPDNSRGVPRAKVASGAHRPARTLLIGASVVGICATLIFSPLVLGKGGLVKYIVAFGLAGFCVGASIILQGTIDLIRNRK